MDFFAKNKVTLIAVAIAVVLGGGWFLFFYEPTVPKDIATGSSTQAAQASARFIELLNRLDEIDLEGDTVLTDPRLDTLIDFAREPSPEPVGKPNPFAPL